jgi:hypothetical protein
VAASEVRLARAQFIHRPSIREASRRDFTPVEQGVVPSLVSDLAFFGRKLRLATYLGAISDSELAQPGQYLGLWNPWICRVVFLKASEIVSSIVVTIPYQDEEPMMIEYNLKSSQAKRTITISGQNAEVETSDGANLPNFRFLGSTPQPVSGVDFQGFREFTLFEFFESEENDVIVSRNVVTTVPFN